MKKFLILFPLFAALLCLASSWFAYRQGVHDGMLYLSPETHHGLVQDGTLLRELRCGQTDRAIAMLETDYYSSADWTLGFGTQLRYPVFGRYLNDLIAYRQEYAHPRAEWTPCEAELEQQLSEWKKGQSKPFEVDLHMRQAIALRHAW